MDLKVILIAIAILGIAVILGMLAYGQSQSLAAPGYVARGALAIGENQMYAGRAEFERARALSLQAMSSVFAVLPVVCLAASAGVMGILLSLAAGVRMVRTGFANARIIEYRVPVAHDFIEAPPGHSLPSGALAGGAGPTYEPIPTRESAIPTSRLRNILQGQSAST